MVHELYIELERKDMKNMLLAATIAGIALAGVILYLANSFSHPGNMINVEDGTRIDY
jgi:alcohol dehydrogenase class IV